MITCNVDCRHFLRTILKSIYIYTFLYITTSEDSLCNRYKILSCNNKLFYNYLLIFIVIREEQLEVTNIIKMMI